MSKRHVAAALVVVGAFGTTVLAAATLKPETLAGWDAYVAATERRLAVEMHSDHGFLGDDLGSDAAADRRKVLSGAIVVRRIEATDGQGESVDVPGGLVHDWRGSVFVPGVTLDRLLDRLEESPVVRQEDVLESKVLDRGPDRLKVFLKLQRKKVITVIYDTEHVVTFLREGPAHASSVSVATKIAEVDGANTPNERELPVGQDRGFLWRWNAYWRYEDTGAGVIVECESLSLSRSVPGLVKLIAGPIISGVARESMERTLGALREEFAGSR